MAKRVAIIGCGRIAWAHALGWQACADAVIVAVADPSVEARDRMGDAYGVSAERRYESYDALFASEAVDTVSVCAWTAEHLPVVAAASAAGVRLIVCEKPMADSLGAARDMRLAAGSAGARLIVGHQRRFYPAWSRARELVAAGAIGTPTHAWTRVADGLLNNATHAVDLVRYVLGDPGAQAVVGALQRNTDRHERGARIEDSAVGLVLLEGDVRVFVESDIVAGGRPIANAAIHGTEGTIRVHEDDVSVLGTDTSGWLAVETPAEPVLADEPWRDPSDPGMAAVAEMIGHHLGPGHAVAFARTFVDQAREAVAWADGRQDDHRCEARHGYASLEIVLAIAESVRRREIVRLPLQTRDNPLDLLVDSGALPVTRPGAYDIRFTPTGSGVQ